MLTVNDLRVQYAGVIALDGVSLDIAAGEAVGLIGSNGAGKTTLLKAISGLVPYTGAITLEGQELNRRQAHEVPRLGVAHVPESARLFPGLTVQQNLALGAYPHGEPQPEDFDRVYELFPRLKERTQQIAGTLSGGERQMAAIARGLMLRPKILLLDEPSLGIAPVLIARIFETIASLVQQGQTMLLVEQNVGECLDVVSRAYVLQTGRIVHTGTADELRTSEAVRTAYLGL